LCDTRESSAQHPSPHSHNSNKGQPATRDPSDRCVPHPTQLAHAMQIQHRISEVRAYFGSSSDTDTDTPAAMGGRWEWEGSLAAAWPSPGRSPDRLRFCFFKSPLCRAHALDQMTPPGPTVSSAGDDGSANEPASASRHCFRKGGARGDFMGGSLTFN